MTPDFRSLYSIFVTAEGVPSENQCRGNEIKGIYFANDGANVFVVAYKADENKITPIVVVDGQQCTLKAAYFNEGITMVFITPAVGQVCVTEVGQKFR